MDRIHTMELVRSYQVGELSRRDFLAKASTALGSAAAASMLVAACTPVTGPTGPVVLATQAAGAEPSSPASGVVTSLLRYPDGQGGTLTGYLARPAGDGKAPAVIVIQEWWGLNDNIKDIARRFAAEGFVALAPDLYHGQVVSEPNEARKLVMALDMDAAVGEIQAAIDFLLQQQSVAGSKVGLTGFCMGGRLVLMTALVDDRLGAAVPWYGGPLSAEQAGQVKAPILGLYGEQDGGIPAAAVRDMQQGLDAAGIANEMVIYPGAQHAFFNDTRPSYHPQAAADAWQRTLAWFHKYLVG